MNPKSSPKSPPDSGKPSISDYLNERGRKPAVVGVILAALVMGAYVGQLAVSISKPPVCSGDCSEVPTGRPLDLRAGRIQATQFDKDLDWPEWLMGIAKLRRLIGNLARGHVLEVAVGTGRLIEHIDWDDVKALAPAPTTDGQVVPGWEPKSPEELQAERVKRRIKKGSIGKMLPEEDSPEVLSFTGVDVSSDVLEVAWTKVKRIVPELVPKRRKKASSEDQGKTEPQTASSTTAGPPPASYPPTTDNGEMLAVDLAAGRIRLFKLDAQKTLPTPPQVVWPDGSMVPNPPTKYDTILQNFGLCSVSDPVQLLAKMAGVLQPHTGRIYLLEHGRGWYDVLNGWLDKFAPSHFSRYGCWWNRDIEGILREAEKSVPGLQVVAIKRPLWLQAGTMIMVELQVVPE